MITGNTNLFTISAVPKKQHTKYDSKCHFSYYQRLFSTFKFFTFDFVSFKLTFIIFEYEFYSILQVLLGNIKRIRQQIRKVKDLLVVIKIRGV